MIQPTAIAFTGMLAWQFPELLDRFGVHLADHDGEVLPHVFMAEVERWAEHLVCVDSELLAELLAMLDIALRSGHEAVANVIDVSFVENLPYPGEPNSEIRDILPPGLRALLRHGS